MSGTYVVIMAGGSGTRFWPTSRANLPKQFLAIGSEKPLLRETYERVLPLVPRTRVYVVTGQAHADHARKMLPELGAHQILVEPAGRNTAPCIAWATHTILRNDPEARIAVLPADHFIADVKGFLRHLEAALIAAEDRIILFGIVPTQPETGYGYILRGANVATKAALPVDLVERFVEKPAYETAMEYLRSGRYLWNSGMFVFRGQVMAEEIKRLLPDLHRGVLRIIQVPAELRTVFPTLPATSIDYGIMEKSDRVAVMPASFGWSDVGSWDAAMDIEKLNAEGNSIAGDVFAVGVKRSMIRSRGGRFVGVVGVEDLIIVDEKDSLVVIKRGTSQHVKHIVDELVSKGRKELL